MTTSVEPIPLTIELLKERARDFMETICNDRSDPNFTRLRQTFAPGFRATHADYPPNTADAFIDTFNGILKTVPNFRCDIKGIIAELDGDEGKSVGRVWVFSRIMGPYGLVESVDMMVFDEKGLLKETKDVQRKVEQ